MWRHSARPVSWLRFEMNVRCQKIPYLQEYHTCRFLQIIITEDHLTFKPSCMKSEMLELKEGAYHSRKGVLFLSAYALKKPKVPLWMYIDRTYYFTISYIDLSYPRCIILQRRQDCDVHTLSGAFISSFTSPFVCCRCWCLCHLLKGGRSIREYTTRNTYKHIILWLCTIVDEWRNDVGNDVWIYSRINNVILSLSRLWRG